MKSQEEKDLINKWKHNSELYYDLREKKAFHLKVELPNFKLSQVVTGDVEDLVTGTTLESFVGVLKDSSDTIETYKKEVHTLERLNESKDKLLELKDKEIFLLKNRPFFKRLFNK